jgi:hypothetical protein
MGAMQASIALRFLRFLWPPSPKKPSSLFHLSPSPPVDRIRSPHHLSAMSTEQLTTAAMALPLSERVSLAQSLWQSIDAGLTDITEADALRTAIRRDQELSSGAAVGRTHEEVMRAARRAIGCS